MWDVKLRNLGIQESRKSEVRRQRSGIKLISDLRLLTSTIDDYYQFNDLNGFNDFNDVYRNIKSKTQMNANAETTPKIEDSTMT
jgi:hypothetical protein